MIFRFSTPSSMDCEPAGRISAMMLVRLALALVITVVLIATTRAANGATLRGDVIVSVDSLTLGDLVEGVPAEAAGKLLFRSPALGQSGTIQSKRIIDAARSLGVSNIETSGRMQIVVTRAARRIGSADIESAVKRALQTQHGVNAHGVSINFDSQTPALIVAPDVQGQVNAEDVTYDRRTRRLSALVWIGPSATERKASLRVTGLAVEYAEVAVLTRSLSRGESVQASDVAIERRVRDTVPADAQVEPEDLAGRVARRSLQAGSLVRAGDLARPEIVGRGDVVTIVYEVPGMTLTMRGRANDAGAQGDTVSVLNPQSKKTLQAQVIGPGKVSVSAPLPGRVASNTSPVQP